MLPAGALLEEVLVEPDRGAGLQHMRRGNPRLRYPPVGQQLPKVAGISPMVSQPGHGVYTGQAHCWLSVAELG
jgi:hypothetical protein